MDNVRSGSNRCRIAMSALRPVPSFRHNVEASQTSKWAGKKRAVIFAETLNKAVIADELPLRFAA
jgi:hypothetical protein